MLIYTGLINEKIYYSYKKDYKDVVDSEVR